MSQRDKGAAGLTANARPLQAPCRQRASRPCSPHHARAPHLTADGDPKVTASASSAAASAAGSMLVTPTVSYVRMQLTLKPLASRLFWRSPEARADAG